MKRIIVALVLIALTAVGCNCDTQTVEEKELAPMFVRVGSEYCCYIVYHKDTKVMYAVSASSYNYGAYTVLVNPDGTPMLWEEEE